LRRAATKEPFVITLLKTCILKSAQAE